MTITQSLTASAQAYEAVGLFDDAAMCRMFARDCEAFNREIPGFGDGLYRFRATEQATRATEKLFEFHQEGQRAAQ
jgi:hypothetical protein